MQVFVYTCAPLSDEFETTDSKPGFGQQNQFCVALRSVLFLQKTLSNGDDDRIDFFDFFTIEKRELLQQRTFVCRTAIHYQSDFNFDTALNTVLPFYTNTAFMPTLHINAAHISISQAYYFIAIYYQSDHSILLLYKKSHFTQHHFHVGFTQQRQHSSVALLTQYCLFRHRSTCGSTQRNCSKS